MFKKLVNEYMQSYYEMQLISDKFENNLEKKNYKNLSMVTDREYIISLLMTIERTIGTYYKQNLNLNFITSIYVDKKTNNVKCLKTIKVPIKDLYNSIIPSLLWKLNSLQLDDVYILNDKPDGYFYDNNECDFFYLKEVEAIIINNNDEETLEKISNFINTVNLYNETIYDKLVKKYKRK